MQLSRSIPNLVNHQYGICRMYSEENPQDFRLPLPCLYPCERVMLLLSAEASFKSSGPIFCRPPLEHKRCGYSIFCTEKNREPLSIVDG